MAIAFDASSSIFNNYANTATWSHTCAGTDRILLVGLGMLGDAPPTHPAVSVTYNGVALTRIRFDNNTGTHTELWYLTNPAAGTASILVTHDGTFTTSWFVGMGRSYTGVHQTTPILVQGSNATIGSLLTSLTTPETDTMIVDVATKYDTTTALVARAGQTATIVSTGGAGWGLYTAMSHKAAPTAGVVTTGYTYADSNDGVMSAIALKQSAVSVGSTARNLTLLGVGS